ncbi:MAG TPA: hypothetical protein VM933_07730 [Acidimicrobiales bacterium]|nr:hypothetical protein [Acidimicrobiales bacterium]
MTASLAPASGPTPLDPYDRRAEWQLAALVLALLATAGWGGVIATEGSVARPTTATGVRRAPAARRATAAGRVLRPPRSC